MKTTLFITFSLLTIKAGLCQSVNLDPVFGNGGVDSVFFLNNAIHEAPWEITLQPNGKILVLGVSGDGVEASHFVVRLNPDGAVDETFGQSGVAVIETDAEYPDLRGINIQSDGKILISGVINNAFGIFRLDSLGTIDPTFGTGGLCNTPFCGFDAIEDLATNDSGEIAAAGYSCEFNARFTIAMFKPDGTLDSSFNQEGYFASEFNDAFRSFNTVAFQDNMIVAAGHCHSSTDVMKDMVYAIRLDSTGQLDPGFGNNGEFAYTNDWDTEVYDMVIQPDGKILICFDKIVRLNSDGTIDGTFGDNGILTPEVDMAFVTMKSLALQADGRIVAAGEANRWGNAGGGTHNVIARYTADGTPDNSFGSNGIILSPVGNRTVYFRSSYLQPDNKILTAGFFYYNTGYQSRIVLARYLPVQSAPVGIQPLKQEDIILYPNPAGDFVYLKFATADYSKELTWQISDVTGKKISNGLMKDSSSGIYTGKISPAVYYLQVNDKEGRVVKTFKVIKR